MSKIIIKMVSVLILFTFLTVSSVTVFAYDIEPFSDVPTTHWAYQQIMSMARQDIISGYPDKTFKPEKYVSREEFAKILCGATSLPIANPNSNTFADITNDHWAFRFVETVKDYLTGYPALEGVKPLFKGKQDATREDVAVALVKIKGFDKSVSPNPTILDDMFKDVNTISSQLKNLIAIAVEKELITGYPDNTIRGTQTVTRAEAAALIDRANRIAGDIKGSSGVSSAKLVYLMVGCSKSVGKVGDTLQASAKGIYSTGQTRDIKTEVKWNSSNNSVLTIDNDGEVCLKKAGTAKIIAVLDDKSDSQEITALAQTTSTEPDVKSIQITPQTKELKVSGSVTLKAEAIYDNGKTFNVTNDCKWECTNNDIVLVSSQGKAVGLKAGTVLVKATYKNKTGFSALTVTQTVYTPPATNPVVSLESISCPNQYKSVCTGDAVKLQIIGNYSDGSKKDLSDSAALSSDNSQIAEITTSNMVKAKTEGVAKITASKDGKSCFVFIVVTEN